MISPPRQKRQFPIRIISVCRHFVSNLLRESCSKFWSDLKIKLKEEGIDMYENIDFING